VDDNGFGVPAGWYPDPLGLPQLRWWDAQAWTEHTSEARAPIVIQPATTRLGYIDDDLPRFDDDLPRFDEELPSRREQRERERRENGNLLEVSFDPQTDFVREELSAQPLLEMTLRELEPPLENTLDFGQPGPRHADSHETLAPSLASLGALTAEEAPVRTMKKTRTYTVAVWLIAIMPLLQLATSVLLITTLDQGHNLPLMLVVWIAPYLLILGLAAYDRLVLQTWGHRSPASTLWAFLTAPAYLIARAVRTFRETGKGSIPIVAWSVSAVTVLAGILVLPGLLISLLPGLFASEVESSVAADATALGAKISLSCPAPPLLVGQTFTCQATKPNGESDSVAVSLQRENGWITWRVEDWGIWVMVS
jgi:hypothetical protein